MFPYNHGDPHQTPADEPVWRHGRVRILFRVNSLRVFQWGLCAAGKDHPVWEEEREELFGRVLLNLDW